MTPLLDDPDWSIAIRPSRMFTEGQLSHTLAVPGFVCSGKGAFEFCIQPKQGLVQRAKRFLSIRPVRLVQFPKSQTTKSLETILPLVIGPVEIVPDLVVQHDTSLPLELWPQQNGHELSMVYEGYRLFHASVEPPINVAIHEMWDSGIPGKIWDSALVMLDFIKLMIQHHPDYMHQKHTLDLSAGTGLLGLYIASKMKDMSTLQEGKITITELDEAVDLIDKNLAINRFLMQTQVNTRNLLWGNQEQAKACGKADLIIASDVLYEAQFFEDLVKAFVDLSTKHTRIYIGYKRRGLTASEEDRFWSLCAQHFDLTLLKYQGQDDLDDELVPAMTLETGVQIYRLLPNASFY
ncbi:putative methyltransferase-domain-containing protein [Choanephora cucurbitarum]|nr:putative methyltransferase-domain-containing protein [Choanephora cucurbitarum]